jgi:hypothetical protein
MRLLPRLPRLAVTPPASTTPALARCIAACRCGISRRCILRPVVRAAIATAAAFRRIIPTVVDRLVGRAHDTRSC